MPELQQLSGLYQQYLAEHPFKGNPESLYQPMQYMMTLGGKRIRPLLVLCGAHCAGGNPAAALEIAHAMEVFHNFTLVHDDIMDNATVRRGKPVVHVQWNEPTAILAGDNMLIAAVECLNQYTGRGASAIMGRFLHTAREICEGQQLDMDFATRPEVSEAEYLRMIQLKTAVLLGCSLQCGAMSAGADLAASSLFYDYATDLGMAFQLMDDWLDTFGDPSLTGKKAGGDIAEGKKTWLYIRAVELGADVDSIFAIPDEEQRIRQAVELFHKLGLDAALKARAEDYYRQGEAALTQIRNLGYNTAVLEEIRDFLTQRTH